MALRWTEEDLKDYQARQKRQALSCVRPVPSGVSVAHLRGSDLPGIAKEKPPQIEHHDEIDAWNYAALGVQKAKRNKYGNRRVEVDGIIFDSQKEARYYQELMLRYKAGELKLLLLQVTFILPGNVKYRADFVTVDHDGNIEVIDVKSEITKKNRTYINKKKQMKAVWGIEIKEV